MRSLGCGGTAILPPPARFLRAQARDDHLGPADDDGCRCSSIYFEPVGCDPVQVRGGAMSSGATTLVCTLTHCKHRAVPYPAGSCISKNSQPTQLRFFRAH